MVARFSCPNCKRELSGPGSVAGSEVQCPSCLTVFVAGDRRRSEERAVTPEHRPAIRGLDSGMPFRRPVDDENAPSIRASRGNDRVLIVIMALVLAPLLALGVAGLLLIGPGAIATTAPVPANKLVWPGTGEDEPFSIPDTDCTVSMNGENVTLVSDVTEKGERKRRYEANFGRDTRAVETIHKDECLTKEQIAEWLDNYRVTFKLPPGTRLVEEHHVQGELTPAGCFVLERCGCGEAINEVYFLPHPQGTVIIILSVEGAKVKRSRGFFDSIKRQPQK
jgi:hypothetical protein